MYSDYITDTIIIIVYKYRKVLDSNLIVILALYTFSHT